MKKSLVIVESPNKVKTINKILGDNYIVTSSVGHIRDLPKSASVANSTTKKETALSTDTKKKITSEQKKYNSFVKRMGIDPENGWNPNYEVMPDKIKVVKELKKLASSCSDIYLATDLDREGESIAWHLKEVIGKKHNYKRVIFNEITPKAVKEAFNNPTDLDIKKVNAQQTRRFLDRIVGFMLSPLLWAKVARGLSAGRVQSVAMKLLVEREREIKSFVPIEYWNIFANSKEKVQFSLISIDGNKITSIGDKNEYYLHKEEVVNKYISELKNSTAIISSVNKKKTKTNPRAPFTTSLLQQSASTRLGFSIKKTMMVAQSLYENGHITYMRTDATNLSKDSINMVRKFIANNFEDKYLPKKENVYITKNSSAQEAHEAIRPTSLDFDYNKSNLSDDQKKLYSLIRNRFISCQMSAAEFTSTTILMEVKTKNHIFVFKSTGSVMDFPGWQKVMKPSDNENDNIINHLYSTGDKVDFSLDSKQNFTSPPPRFSEASLVKELEKMNIGRPSTYVSIISTIQDRGYVAIENKRFHSLKIAEIVTDRLNYSFPNIMNYAFTAKMEEKLDEISNGKLDWKKELDNFYKEFKKSLIEAEKDPQNGGMSKNSLILTNIGCKTCGRKMGVKTASSGVFLSCEGYQLPPKERCKTTLNLIAEDKIYNEDDFHNKKRCKKCNNILDFYYIDNSKGIYICSDNPNCDYTEIKIGEFKLAKSDKPTIKCDKCEHGEMHFKTGRFGNYMACDNCNNTRRVLANGEIAPPKKEAIHYPELPCIQKGSYFCLRQSTRGIFFSANNFPKCRETHPVYIKILKEFPDRLTEELRYLLDAPEKDNNGNLTLVKYSLKDKSQYLISEDDNKKPTGWKAEYIDNKWIITKELTIFKEKNNKKTSTKKISTKK